MTKQTYHTETQMSDKARANASALAERFKAEANALVLLPLTKGKKNPTLAGWLVVNTVHEETLIDVTGATVPTFEDALIANEAAGYVANTVEASGSIVKETYRKRYKDASTTGQSCGDWLAETLTAWTYDHVNGFNAEEFWAVLEANAIDLTKPWALLFESGQRGWRGRFRMNGRQVMEKFVALRGFIKQADGTTLDVPEDELAFLRAKHVKWIAKEEKRQALADEAAKS